VPGNPPKVNWELVSTVDTTFGNIKAVTKNLIGHVDNSSYPQIKVDIQLSLTTPKKNISKPVPVIIEFGFVFPPGFRFPSPPPGTALQKSWQEQVLEKGWGFDKVYDTLFVRPIVWLSVVDKKDFIDLWSIGLSRLAVYFNRVLSLTQNGKMRWYLLSFAIGIAIILTYMLAK
jgi:hypothetical protein